MVQGLWYRLAHNMLLLEHIWKLLEFHNVVFRNRVHVFRTWEFHICVPFSVARTWAFRILVVHTLEAPLYGKYLVVCM